MFRVRGSHWILRQLHFPHIVLKHFHTRNAAITIETTPYMSHRERLLNTLSHGNLLGLRRGKHNVFLRSRKPVYSCASTHSNSTLNIPLISRLAQSVSSANTSNCGPLTRWQVVPKWLVDFKCLKIHSTAFVYCTCVSRVGPWNVIYGCWPNP